MTTATLTFQKLIQEVQDVSSTDPKQNHVVSKAFFRLDVNDQHYADMSVIVRQPFGTDYAKEPIEVEKPFGSYAGNWNQDAFRKIVEDYYRSAIGSQGRAMRIGPGSENVRMRGNTIGFSKSYQLEIPQ
jgi:hypothetical protein